jgi:putative methionine-R-sulfoxide reductase with GAF domain
MPAFPKPEDRFPSSNRESLNRESSNRESMDAGTNLSLPANASGDASKRNGALEEQELESALQLLVERALYITGATGAALALPQDDEMVCRASSGISAPVVGARMQVLSGLTGESIARRQLLRCDNAETDPRVNLEACRSLGIASIVVLPLFRQNGEVRGLIELFSDHPYAFEERDLVALERMAELTSTALDLAEERLSSASTLRRPAPARSDPPRAIGSEVVTSARPEAAVSRSKEVGESTLETASLAAAATMSISSPAVVPDAMRRMQKCSSCGFPVSEGRTICLDCEKKKQPATGQSEIKKPEQEREPSSRSAARSAPLAPEEFVPPFLANATLVKESWWSNPVNLLALFVLILGILVAVVVFR